MAYDRREAILQRMFAILATIDGPATVDGLRSVFRNRGEVPPEKMPALMLLDGREEIRISASGKGGILATTVFTLQPQVYIVLRPTPDVTNDGIGEELSRYRLSVLKAFTSDDDLFALLGSNGEMQYLGNESDMTAGGAMLGQMLMLFSLSYPLNPKDY